MKIRVNAAWAGVGLALMVVAATPALADEWNKQIVFHFNAPVEIPGHVLLPGSYDFQLADSLSDRNIVEVFRQDKKGREHIVDTLLVIPDYRAVATDKPVITFEERRTGTPEAVHSWFYPGDNYGWEFMYRRAQRLESAMNAPAPAPKPAPIVAAAPTPAPAPQGEANREVQPPVEMAEAAPAPAPAARPTPAPAQKAASKRELPKTASNLPLAELAGGLMLLAGGFLLWLAPGRS